MNHKTILKRQKKLQQAKMDFNCEQMFLLAKIEFLQKENDALKEERVTTLQKLELAEISVSLLKAEIGVVKDAKQTEMFEHQIEMAKMIRKLGKARKDGEAKIASIESHTKAKIAKIESDFDVKHQNQTIVHESKLQEAINDASAEMAAFKRQKEEEVNEWTLRYEDLKMKVQAQNSSSVKIIKDPFLREEVWCKLGNVWKWGQNDENIFLGDETKFRLDPADIVTSENFHKSLAHHLNWWLKLNKTEKGRQFLAQPEIIKYRNDVCLAIHQRFLERIRESVRQSPRLFKTLRQN